MLHNYTNRTRPEYFLLTKLIGIVRNTQLIITIKYTLPSYLTVESLTVLQDNLIRVRWSVSERDQSAAEEKHVADNDSLGTVASKVAFSKH